MTAAPSREPHPNSRPCADCGHVWFAGERQHVVFARDQPAGPAAGDEVICVLCQRVRERDEGRPA